VREEYKTKLADIFHRTINRQSAEGRGISPEEKLALIDRAESPELQLAHFVSAKHELENEPLAKTKLNHERRQGFSIDPLQVAE